VIFYVSDCHFVSTSEIFRSIQLALIMYLTFCLSESPKGQGNCPRLNGVHKDPKGCGSFYKCENGSAISDRCSEGLEFDDYTKLCRLATQQERTKCSYSSTSTGKTHSQCMND
jgi:hypothetical protein